MWIKIKISMHDVNKKILKSGLRHDIKKFCGKMANQSMGKRGIHWLIFKLCMG